MVKEKDAILSVKESTAKTVDEMAMKENELLRERIKLLEDREKELIDNEILKERIIS